MRSGSLAALTLLVLLDGTARHAAADPPSLDDLRPIEDCRFELALEAPLSEGEALADHLIAFLEQEGVGTRRKLSDVLANLDRRGRPGLSERARERMGHLGAVGFRWNESDERVRFWYPQGISGSSDAFRSGNFEGRRLFLVSWYHRTQHRPGRGVRLTLVDATNPEEVRYRHILLVEPRDGPDGVTFGPATYDNGISLHAGGIAWSGPYVLVADTSRGLRIYDLRRLFELSHTSDPERIGIGSGRSDAHGHRYAVPRVARLHLTESSCRTQFSFAGLSRDGDDPVLVTGEYRIEPTGRLVVWPVNPRTDLLATREGITRARVAAVVGRTRVQGALRVGDRHYLSSSNQEPGSRNGRLYEVGPQSPGHSVPWVYGCEDLYFERSTASIWTPGEHPGARDVVGIPLRRAQAPD